MFAIRPVHYKQVPLIQRRRVPFLSLGWRKPDCFNQHLENRPAWRESQQEGMSAEKEQRREQQVHLLLLENMLARLSEKPFGNETASSISSNWAS